MHGEGTTGVGGVIRPSLRNGFTAYTRSPQEPGFLAPVARSSLCALDTSVGVSGPRDFAVRISGVRPHDYRARRQHVHRIPLSTFVTIAKRPSGESRTAEDNHIFPKNGIVIFAMIP